VAKNIKKKIFYWSPFLVPIATPKAVINSAYALKKFSKQYDCYILNFFGEFNIFKKLIINKKIFLINYFNFNILKFLPSYGLFKSRFSFLLIFFLSFFPLKNLLKKEKPEYLIIHLITSLPLILLLIFSFKTKFILRISGMPRLGFFRKILWKYSLQKIYYVTCPTKSTAKYLKSLNIVNSDKIKILYDPVIDSEEINKKIKKSKSNLLPKEYFLAAGRLTYQKNFIFLCKSFMKVLQRSPKLKLIIAGEGEDEINIRNFIKEKQLQENIYLIGYIENIYPIIKRARAFILSSLWEDPGFVLLESAYCKTPVISSDCKTGPREILKNNFNAFVFQSNNTQSFERTFNSFLSCKQVKKIVKNNFNVSKKFSLKYHYVKISKILQNDYPKKA